MSRPTALQASCTRRYLKENFKLIRLFSSENQPFNCYNKAKNPIFLKDLGYSKCNSMARPSTLPTLYDECKTISISDLNRWAYLKLDQLRSGTITWSRNGNKTGCISIIVNTCFESPYLELDYKCGEKPIKYRVPLVSAPANIGKGLVWFFLCPQTGKQCRKLYLGDTYFLHRLAFKGCMYEKQTYSPKNRILFKKFDIAFGTDKFYEQLYRKYFKTHYAGRPTKRYLIIKQKIEESERIPYWEKELLYLA